MANISQINGNLINAATASYLSNLTQSLTLTGNLNITGNLSVLGTASFVYTTQSIVNIGAGFINLNTDYPAARFGGINVVDSGSFGNSSTGSILWDSLNNRWIYSNPSGSSYNGGMLISGPRNTSSLGDEQGTTLNALMKGQGGDHITSSGVYEINNNILIGTPIDPGLGKLYISGSIAARGAGLYLYDASGYGGGRIYGSYGYLNGEVFIRPSSSIADNFIFSPNNGMSIGGFTIGGTAGSPPAYGLAVSGSIGVGTRVPIASIHVRGTGSSSTSTALRVENSTTSASLTFLNNGSTIITGSITLTSGISASAGALGNGIEIYGSNKNSFANNTGLATFWAGDYSYATSSIVGMTFGNQNSGNHRAAIVYESTGRSLNFYTNALNFAGQIYYGNWLLSSTTATLQAKLHVRSDGTSSSATKAFHVENTSSNALFVVLDNGFVGVNTGSAQYNLDVNGTSRFISQSYYGTFSESPTIYQSDTSGNYLTSAASLTFALRNGGGGSGRFIFSSPAKAGTTTSTQYLTQLTATYNPTSGTGLYTMMELNPTINQTGGANGITRGIHINSTLISAANYRAIETTAGSVIFGGTGSALAIGTSSLGPNENTLTLGARDAVNEGGQIGFNAPGGTYTSASFIDLYQNRIRILKGTNAGSTGEVANWSMHSLQMSLPAYTSPSSFTGTPVAGLGVDSGGNIVSSTRTGRYGTALSGSTIGTGVTAQTIVYSQLIPANTWGADDIFRTYFRFRKLSTNSNATYNILVNTSNAVAGATTLATFTGNTVHTQIKRDFYIAQGNATTGIGSGVSVTFDDTNNTQTLNVINWAVDQYIIYTVTLGTTDSGYGLGYTIEQVL